MTIKELNNLKEQIGSLYLFNKSCLLKEYERRNIYQNEIIAIEEYKNEINMSIQRLTSKSNELTGIDMEELYKAIKIVDNFTYDLSKLEYLSAVRIMDCYYNNFLKVFMLILKYIVE